MNIFFLLLGFLPVSFCMSDSHVLLMSGVHLDSFPTFSLPGSPTHTPGLASGSNGSSHSVQSSHNIKESQNVTVVLISLFLQV